VEYYLTMDIDSDKLQKIFINPTIGNGICKVIISQLFPAQHIVEVFFMLL